MHRHLHLRLLLLLILTATQIISPEGKPHAFGGYGRGATINPEPSAATLGAVEVAAGRGLIGSRPPSCQWRCAPSCGGRCEAVQVPVAPERRLGLQYYRRDDDATNYKPLSWKCRCGDMILNP